MGFSVGNSAYPIAIIFMLLDSRFQAREKEEDEQFFTDDIFNLTNFFVIFYEAHTTSFIKLFLFLHLAIQHPYPAYTHNVSFAITFIITNVDYCRINRTIFVHFSLLILFCIVMLQWLM
jgi:hypothetical protein